MKKYGLLGEKLGHSFSKDIHDLFLEMEKIDGSYTMIEKKKKEIPGLLEEIRKGEYTGLNVTVPYKLEIMKYLDEISTEAEEIGAVNTVVLEDEKLVGYNTDYYGFLKILEVNNIDVENSRVLILGTGGAAKSVYSVLRDKKADKIFLASTRENNNFKRNHGDRIIRYAEIPGIKSVDLVVNCTPVGMFPDVDVSPLQDNQMVETKYLIDLIYNPEETVLMKKYKLKGTRVINGFGMLIVQAINSQEIWNKEKYDEKIYMDIYEKLKEKLYR